MNKYPVQLVLLLGLLLLQWLPPSASSSTPAASSGEVDLTGTMEASTAASGSANPKWDRLGPAGVIRSGYIDGPYGLKGQAFSLAVDKTNKPWVAFAGLAAGESTMTLQVRRWGGSAWQSVRTNGLPSDNAFRNPNLVIDQKVSRRPSLHDTMAMAVCALCATDSSVTAPWQYMYSTCQAGNAASTGH